MTHTQEAQSRAVPALLKPMIQKRTITEYIDLPAREVRVDSAEFNRNKHMLVKRLDVPCWICGSREKREVHHLHEHAMAPSLDFDKVADTLMAIDVYGYSHQLEGKPIESMDDIRNLIVLCEDHHRTQGTGVHASTFDLWLAQRAARDGVKVSGENAGANAHKGHTH